MSQTIQLRQKNPDAENEKAQYESPDGDDVCASYMSDVVHDAIGEFAEVEVSDGDANVQLTGVSGSGSGNYAIYKHPGGGITGFYLSHDVWSEVLGVDVETDENGNITNAPETLRFNLRASSEEAWEDANTVSEEDVSDLLGDSSEDDSDEEEVEISDEELDLIEQ